MSLSTIRTLARREVSDALRNRWFVAYSLAFVVLSVALAFMIVSSTATAASAASAGHRRRSSILCLSRAVDGPVARRPGALEQREQAR